jgi:hypothetical protein
MMGIIVSGIVTVIIIYFMISNTDKKAQVKDGRCYILPSNGLKIFSMLIIPFTLFVLYAISQSYKGQEVPAFLVGILFVFSSIFLPYYTFFVKLSYDEDNVYYKTPFSNKKSSWQRLQEIGHSSLLQTDYFVIDGIGKIWCSEMMHGYEALGKMLEKKSREIDSL